jgi:serine protease Do
MKSWNVIIAIILALGIALMGFLYGQQSAEISALKSEVSSLRDKPVAGVASTPTASVSSPISNAMVNLIPQIEPCIVRINVTGSGFQAGGSGLIVRNDGYIITNAHVIENYTRIQVAVKGGQQYPATFIASDAVVDLAILKLSGSPSDLPLTTLGQASDIIIGVSVVAAGYPLGSTLPGPASFSRGIVSALRTVDGQTYVQTDATINPGSSGGGLFTLDGKLIGITSSAILPRNMDVDGIGLAVPVEVVQNYIRENLK